MSEEEKQKERFDFDGFWKDLIERFWRELLKSLLPSLYAVADLTKEPAFLDKELRDVLHISDDLDSPRFVDVLLKIPLKDGGDEWVLLHIEVQGPGFDLALYAARRAKQSRDDENMKFRYLRELRRVLGRKGWTDRDCRDLLIFIEWIINLKDQELREDYASFKDETEETRMRFKSLSTDHILEEGRMQGITIGRSQERKTIMERLIADGMEPARAASLTGMAPSQAANLTGVSI